MSAETYHVPSECPNCGGAIDYAERNKDNSTITLCRGDCGEWTALESV